MYARCSLYRHVDNNIAVLSMLYNVLRIDTCMSVVFFNGFFRWNISQLYFGVGVLVVFLCLHVLITWLCHAKGRQIHRDLERHYIQKHAEIMNIAEPTRRRGTTSANIANKNVVVVVVVVVGCDDGCLGMGYYYTREAEIHARHEHTLAHAAQ